GPGRGAVRDGGRGVVQPRPAGAGDPVRGSPGDPAVVPQRGRRIRGHGRGRRLQLELPAGLAPDQQAVLSRRGSDRGGAASASPVSARDPSWPDRTSTVLTPTPPPHWKCEYDLVRATSRVADDPGLLRRDVPRVLPGVLPAGRPDRGAARRQAA